MNRRWMTIVCVLVVLGITGATFACPMCKDSIPTSDAAQAGTLPSGFNNSVYFILVGFLTVLGTVIAMIVKAIRETGRRAGFQVIDNRTRRRDEPVRLND